jgi:hypothetical protein
MRYLTVYLCKSRGLAYAAALVLSACAGTGQSNDSGPSENVAQREEELHLLADDYLYKETTEQESAQVFARIRALDVGSARRFHDIIAELQGSTGVDRMIFDATFEAAVQRGVSFLDLPDDEAVKVVRNVAETLDSATIHQFRRDNASIVGTLQEPSESRLEKAACQIWQTQCMYVNYWTGPAGGALAPTTTCTDATCTIGSLWDRTGNDQCEDLACDYRIRFTRTGATKIDGRTALADCMLTKYAGISKYEGAPYTYALVGYGSAVKCGAAGLSGEIQKNFMIK